MTATNIRLRVLPRIPPVDGEDGDAATIAVGVVSTLPPGSPATVTNVGTTGAAVLNFGIPSGLQGSPGADGDDGQDGADGTDGIMASVVAGTGITVNSADPANPTVGISNGGVTTTQLGGDITTAGKAILDDADAAAQRTTLGLGSVATLAETTSAQWRNNTADKALSTDQVWGAMAEVGLTDAATIAWDMSTGFDFTVTLGGNRTLGNPTNTKVGQRGRIRVVQDGTGGRTLTKSSNHKTVGGAALSLSAAAGAEDYIDYDVVSATKIRLTVSKGWS